MQTTYLKNSASSLLKTATVAQTKAGEWVVFVTVPKMGDCIARIWGRSNGWGGTVQDVLGLENAHGETLSLKTTSRSLATLEALLTEAERKQRADLKAEG
jgi:hypothetical protein